MNEPLSSALPLAASPEPRRQAFIERIPKWLNLVPMVIQWGWLGLRYGSALRAGLHLHSRRVGCGSRYGGEFPALLERLSAPEPQLPL